MKKNFFWILSFVFLGITAVTTFSSCDTDVCANVVCVNADCFEGECICQVGFVKDANGDCVPACDDANCRPNSACVGNECVCDIGYEDDANGDCVLERAKFLGDWTGAEDCDGAIDGYAVAVFAGVNDDQVEIDNFFGTMDFRVVATIVGTSVTIDRQDPLGDNLFASGTGTMEDGVVTIPFTISDEADPNNISVVNCTVVWTR